MPEAEVIDRGDELAPGTVLEEEQTPEEKAEADRKAAELEAELKKGKEKAPTEDPEKKAPKDTRIPLARHEEVLRKEREARTAAEQRLAALTESQKNQVTTVEITKLEQKLDGLDAEYAKCVSDGELEKAAKLMTQIRVIDRDINTARINVATNQARSEAIATARYDTALARVESAWPQLNVDHDDYDEKKDTEVGDLVRAFMGTGLEQVTALQRAVKYVMGEPKTAKQEESVNVKPNLSDAEKAEAERKATQVKKNLEAATKQPPNAATMGLDSDKHGGGKITATDVVRMSQKDFNTLTDTELSKLRGDTM